MLVISERCMPEVATQSTGAIMPMAVVANRNVVR